MKTVNRIFNALAILIVGSYFISEIQLSAGYKPLNPADHWFIAVMMFIVILKWTGDLIEGDG